MSSVFPITKHNSGAKAKSLKGSEEGKIYEKLSLALLAKRGYDLSNSDNSELRDFAIGREVAIAKEGKFDDLIFKYSDQSKTKNFILVQIKYKQDNYQIDSEILSAEASTSKGGSDGGMRRDFNLQKYFISYLNIKEELRRPKLPEEFENGTIKYVVIFTNIGFNTEDLNCKGFTLKEAPSDIMTLFNLKKPPLGTQQSNHCYQLCNISERLSNILKKSSELHRLARDFARYVVWDKYRENNIMGIDKAPIRHYHVILEREVIYLSAEKHTLKNEQQFEAKCKDDLKDSDKTGMKPAIGYAELECSRNLDETSEKQSARNEQYYEAQFREDFLDNGQTGSKKELKDSIFQAIRELNALKKCISDNDLKVILKEARWKVVPSFNKILKSKINLLCNWRETNSLGLRKIARELALYVTSESHRGSSILGKKISPITPYLVAFEREVFKKSDHIKYKSYERKKLKNKEYCEAQFRLDFLENDKPGTKQQLRDAIIEAVRELDESKKVLTYEDIKQMLKEVKWKVISNFGQVKQTHFDESNTDLPCKAIIDDKHIKEFLECLVFIVNQPRLAELEALFNSSTQDTVVKGTSLRQILDKTENTGSEFRKRLENVLGIDKTTTFKGQWISGEKIVNFIEEQKQLLSLSFITTAVTLIYESEVMRYGKFNKTGKLEKSLDDFLSNSSKILCLNTSETLLSSIKILQHLNSKKIYRAEDGRISISLDIFKCKENRDSVAKAFELEGNNLLTVECKHTINEQDVEEFYAKLFNTVKGNPDKKIIFIIQYGEYVTLIEKIKTVFKDQGLFILDNDSINLKSFEPKEDPLKKEVFVFQEQGKKVSLAKLTGIKDWKSYIEELSEERCEIDHDIIDVITLLKILNNEIIEVGSKPFGTSNLEGVYATLIEEINVKTLANKLISLASDNEDSDDIYIISGIRQKEEMSKLIEYLVLITKKKEIENLFENIGRDSKIQIAPHQFKNEDFKKFCCDYPGKRIFWIYIKYEENKLKFILQQLYNPKFYLKRKFKNVIIKKEVQDLLKEELVYEIFIFFCIKDHQDMCKILKIEKTEDITKVENNCKNGKIKLFSLKALAEAQFQKLSEENQTVHLLKFEKNQLIWCNSHGSWNNLRTYKGDEISVIDEDNLIKEIRSRKVVVMADDPGMGKTTSLTSLYETKYESESFIDNHWVIRINLRDNLKAIRSINLKNGDNLSNVLEFLSKIDLKLNHNLAKSFLRMALDKKRKRFPKHLLLAFDGFDEILDVEDRNVIISLLKFLNNESAAKLWITTRFHHQKTLEHELATFAIEFDPMDDKTQKEYIKNYFKNRFCLILREDEFAKHFLEDHENQENGKIQEYSESFLNKMNFVFKDNIMRFIGTPLQLYLMLEGSMGHFRKWLETDENEKPNFNYLGSDIWDVYKTFINTKYDVYYKKIDMIECLREKQDKFVLNKYNKDLAISFILGSEPKNSLKKYKDIVLSAGIIKSHGIDIEFIHTTLKEYFAAKVCIRWIKKLHRRLPNLNKLEYLLSVILKKPDYQLIRSFINLKIGKMSESQFIENTNHFGNFFEKLLQAQQSPLIDVKGTALHIAVEEGNKNITNFLLKGLKGNRDFLKKFLFIREEFGETALHLACGKCDCEIVKLLLDTAAEISEDTLEEFLHASNDSNANALDEAVERSSNVSILKELLSRAKDKMRLIMDENKYYSSLSVACQLEDEVFVKTLFEEFQHDKNSVKELLLYFDRHGNALYWAINSDAIVEYLICMARELNDCGETLKKLLLPHNSLSRLPIMRAIVKNKKSVVEIILNAALDIDDDRKTFKVMEWICMTLKQGILNCPFCDCIGMDKFQRSFTDYMVNQTKLINK